MKAFQVKNHFLRLFIIPLLTIVASILMFVILYPNLPSTGWYFSIDKFAVLLIIIVLLYAIVRIFWPILLVCYLFISSWYGYKSYTNNYDFDSAVKDYQVMLNNLVNSEHKNFVYTGYGSMYNDKVILSSIDYQNSIVRDFAVEACNTYFKQIQQQTKNDDVRLMIQCFAVFKKINRNWNYVNDPAHEEYFAKASETVSLLAGDCDDYSILMAAAIKSIGGRVRLLCVKGHIYPEIYIGTQGNLQTVGALIQKKLFVDESFDKKINYHNDEKGNVWLNLDYTTYYPGGNFANNAVIEYIYP